MRTNLIFLFLKVISKVVTSRTNCGNPQFHVVFFCFLFFVFFHSVYRSLKIQATTDSKINLKIA